MGARNDPGSCFPEWTYATHHDANGSFGCMVWCFSPFAYHMLSMPGVTVCDIEAPLIAQKRPSASSSGGVHTTTGDTLQCKDLPGATAVYIRPPALAHCRLPLRPCTIQLH